MKKNRLMSPGPTPVPEEVLLRAASPIIHHRTPQFRSILKGVNAKLKKVFDTRNPVLIFGSSGTGAMEAGVVNFLSAGDRAIVINGGKFGGRFSEICRGYNVDPIEYNVEWGEAADPDVLKRLLKENPGVKAVFGTLCETSTGVVNDIRAIGEAVSGTGALLVIDAISGLGADEFHPDAWGVDVVVGGSQKGLMTPPGLSFLSISPRAEEMLKRSGLPKYYFDAGSALRSYDSDDTPWTPSISLIAGLDSALGMILDEGMKTVIARHAHMARATREAVREMGLDLFAKAPSNAVTAVKVPEDIDGEALLKELRDGQGITVAGGQGAYKGKIFRIGHLGNMDDYDIICVLAGLEMALCRAGFELELGRGVARAEEVFTQLPEKCGRAI